MKAVAYSYLYFPNRSHWSAQWSGLQIHCYSLPVLYLSVVGYYALCIQVVSLVLQEGSQMQAITLHYKVSMQYTNTALTAFRFHFINGRTFSKPSSYHITLVFPQLTRSALLLGLCHQHWEVYSISLSYQSSSHLSQQLSSTSSEQFNMPNACRQSSLVYCSFDIDF